MVATVKHNKRTSTTKRNTASQNMRSGKFYFLCSIVVILIVFFSYILYQLKAIKVPKNTTDKQSQIVSKPKYKQIENSYNYTEILESKEIDSGSGVKITRNYEAEKIAKSGFLEGPLILPLFILEELQHIADSSDSLKRNRGRRGLEVMNGIQRLNNIKVIIVENKYEEVEEV